MPLFDPASVNSAVTTFLRDASMGEDRNAFVVVATTQGVKGVISAKIGDYWTVSGVVGIDHEKRIDGGIAVKASWP